MNKVARALLFGQIAFFGSSLICFLLKPEVLSNNFGFSYFGAQAATIVPYSFGLFLSSYFLVKASRILSHSVIAPRFLMNMLEFLAFLIICVLLTPYSINDLFNRLHILAAAVLFLVELSVAVWLIVKMRRHWIDIGLFILEVCGVVIAMSSFLHKIELMLIGQAIVQLSFGVLLVRIVGGLASTRA